MPVTFSIFYKSHRGGGSIVANYEGLAELVVDIRVDTRRERAGIIDGRRASHQHAPKGRIARPQHQPRSAITRFHLDPHFLGIGAILERAHLHRVEPRRWSSR